MIDWKRYVIVFFITAGVFITAFWLSNYFSNKKLIELKTIQDKISIDILSSETQYALLSELSCKDVTSSVLSDELGSLAEKVEYSEKNLGNTDQVTELRKFYSLLEIKDYLLMKKIAERCNVKTVSILYFYTTSENCSECIRQGYVLTALREKYPELRVYSFDYSIDLSAVRALISIYKVEDTKLPAIILDDELYTGFKTIEEMDPLIAELLEQNEVPEDTANTKASSTVKKQ